eukprot:5441886-Alexandrium_andersonii.AAC.1
MRSSARLVPTKAQKRSARLFWKTWDQPPTLAHSSRNCVTFCQAVAESLSCLLYTSDAADECSV